MSEDYIAIRTYKSGEFTITSKTLNTPKEQVDEIVADLRKILAKSQRARKERENNKEPL
ncbi:MAG: hypothetical protein H2184_04230 [Candidatus Galacturonibacter soehngenii]|nr:hypothetical protein [Candidatus Galacturonibacter soehngenii]